jgi:hypothetical protein
MVNSMVNSPVIPADSSCRLLRYSIAKSTFPGAYQFLIEELLLWGVG